jgi:hypothetical protein
LVGGDEGMDLGLGEHRHGIEVELLEGFSGRQVRFAEMTLDAPSGALGEFVLGQAGEQACRGPALLSRRVR